MRRPDGSVEQVRVGSALKTEEGFSLKLGELSIGAEPDRRPTYVPSAPGEAPTIFPPYGRSKGMPIRDATEQDLEYYANGSKRSLADPSKSRWHDKERALLAAIEAEIARQGGGGGNGINGLDRNEPPPPSDDDIPF